VVQALDNLSDGQMEFQRRDRLSFMRVLGPGIEDRVPDATTLWPYREALAKAGMVERLCDAFDAHLRAQGHLAMGGQIIDASIVAAPRQRNGREGNAQVKAGEAPPGFAANPAMDRPKDKDARWTKKHGRSHHGRKNHVSIDRTGGTSWCGATRSPTRPGTTARHSRRCWTRTTRPQACGRTAPTALRPPRRASPSADAPAASTAARPATGRSPRASSGATPPARACAPGASTCSPTKRTPWAANWSAPSA
jgi:hypothetical protein